MTARTLGDLVMDNMKEKTVETTTETSTKKTKREPIKPTAGDVFRDKDPRSASAPELTIISVEGDKVLVKRATGLNRRIKLKRLLSHKYEFVRRGN